MGREIDYKKGAEKDRILNRDIIREKLNREDISSEEIAVILGMTDRSVRNILKKLCEHNERLNLEDFKEGKFYNLKASWNGILTTLLEVAGMPQYDKRKDQHTLGGHLEHLEILLEGIEKYLTKTDQALVKSHGTYQQAMLERKLYESILHRLGNISNQVGMMPSSLRFQTLAGINQLLEKVPSHMAQKNAAYMIEKALYQRQAKEDDEDSVNETSFKEDIEDYLVSLLRLRLQGKEGLEESWNIETVGSTMLEQLILGNLTGIEAKGVDELVTKSRQVLLEQPEIKDTLEKVATVLDPEKPLEKMILNWIKETLLLVTITVSNKDRNKELGKELVRQAVTDQVYRNLQEFNK